MAVNINGSSGISGVDGSAGTPALQGSDSNTGISFGTDEVNINTGGSTRATVDSSGNVGINTTSPAGANGKALTVYASDYPRLRLINDATGTGSGDGSGMFLNSDDLYISNEESAGEMLFRTAATERMRITTSGALCVGTTSALGTSRFAVESDATTVNPMSVSNTRTGIGNDYAILFYRAGSIVGSIQTGLSSTSYTTSSDYRLKENIVPLTGAANRVNQLQVHRFNFIANPDTTVDGFIAHEAQAVVPEAVTGTHDEVDDEGNPVYQGIDQSKLVPLLTAALQEALAKIETLETRLTALEGGTNP